MEYVSLGKTGLTVSRLGFGAMRLPMVGEGDDARVNRDLSTPMIHRAFESGVNYIDTAVGYCNSDSQRALGEALKGWRDKVIVSTKNHYYGEDEGEWWALLEQSLERLDVAYLDIYNHHGIQAKSYAEKVEPRVAKWMYKARDQGLIRHVCTSFHDDNAGLLKIVESGYPEVITLQYNMLDRQLEEGIALAHERGIGVIAMGPAGGGRLCEPTEVLGSMMPGVKRVPELALRFVLSNPNVTMALSGMTTMAEVEENVATANDDVALSAEDKAAIDEHLVRLKKMADLYCTGCKYCMPCPEGVDIPFAFDRYNQGRVYGIWDTARKAYASRDEAQRENQKTASACTECGECEEKCPQDIPIREQLKEAHAALLGD